MGVSINGGTPIAGWFLLGKILLKWMITRGTPLYGNTHMGISVVDIVFFFEVRLGMQAEQLEITESYGVMFLSWLTRVHSGYIDTRII